MQNENQIVIYATTWCPDCNRARKLLEEYKVDYKFVDIEKDAEGKEYVMKINHGNKSVPTIVFPDGSILVEPSKQALTEKLMALKFI